MKPYKNLIFDLGNVIIDIDFQKTIFEFQKLGVVDAAKLYSATSQAEVFDLFETGKISAQEFRNQLKNYLNPNVTDDEITAAWNSILIAYPDDKFQLLNELKPRYKTFALSNTNELHEAAFDKAVREKYNVNEFGDFFHTAYYSHKVGFRKPENEIYEFVLEKENLLADETFFVDDNPKNVKVAQQIGLRAFLLRDRTKLRDLLADQKII